MTNRKQLILFDLGNTLIYRSKSHLIHDIELIKNYNPILKMEYLHELLNMTSKKYPGIYNFAKDNEKCCNLECERGYRRKFFEKIFSQISLHIDLECFLLKREQKKIYTAFPQALNLLKTLASSNYHLGILSNGRPSRRLELEKLHLGQYIDKNLLFISDEIGHAKPSEKTFKKVEGEIRKIYSNEIVFLDDEVINTSVARKFGWDARLVDKKGKWIKKYL